MTTDCAFVFIHEPLVSCCAISRPPSSPSMTNPRTALLSRISRLLSLLPSLDQNPSTPEFTGAWHARPECLFIITGTPVSISTRSNSKVVPVGNPEPELSAEITISGEPPGVAPFKNPKYL